MRIVLALICLTLLGSTVSSRADWQLQSKVHAACRPAHATSYTLVRWKPPGTCTDDCFVSRLTCSNGRIAELQSNIHPATTEFQFAFRSWAPWSFIGYLLPFVAFAAIATLGASIWAPLLAFNGLLVTYAGLAAGSLLASIIGNPWSDWAQWQRIVFLNSYVYGAIIGLFVIVNVRAFIRGLEYFFYRHPADSMMVDPVVPVYPMHAASLHAALMPNIFEFVDPRETASHYRCETERLYAFKDKLNAETALAEAYLRQQRTHNHLNQDN